MDSHWNNFELVLKAFAVEYLTSKIFELNLQNLTKPKKTLPWYIMFLPFFVR